MTDVSLAQASLGKGMGSAPYGRCSTDGTTADSTARFARRRPALFLDPRPAVWPDTSLLGTLEGRLGAAFAPLAVAEFGVCLEAEGGFLEARDGDGDDLDELTPLVWMPGGTGRLIFEGMFGWTAVATGAILATYPRRAVLRTFFSTDTAQLGPPISKRDATIVG